MQRMSKNEIVHGRQISMEETVKNINAITPAQIQDLARRIFPEDQMRTTAIGPE